MASNWARFIHWFPKDNIGTFCGLKFSEVRDLETPAETKQLQFAPSQVAVYFFWKPKAPKSTKSPVGAWAEALEAATKHHKVVGVDGQLVSWIKRSCYSHISRVGTINHLKDSCFYLVCVLARSSHSHEAHAIFSMANLVHERWRWIALDRVRKTGVQWPTIWSDRQSSQDDSRSSNGLALLG